MGYMHSNTKWMKLMIYGEKLGCHQRPERSFFINGYQMPICARCTGVMIGYLFALPLYLLCSFSWRISLAGCVLLLVDWGLQAMKVKESTNMRRLVTGLAGGLGFMSIQLQLVLIIIQYFQAKA